ncbi:zinc carboxypeptidase [Actinomadura barringtoniae]|uniref:Zinc carboxypeptidase n=1 Tax=Actinomadura barringtoniae TaxID=1427535 RepID=A0A939PE34_9ACTN|nr:M14 family metallopeptidase [Actinomadura barringtoniae]MBO2448413.1 zinc carboxypeptidase [Actinomadura barringtoniae]
MVIPRRFATLIAALAALVMVTAMQPIAQAAPDPGSHRYLVTGAKTPQQRSGLARTGASIDRVRDDGSVEVSAIPAEVAAIKRLGLKLSALPAEKPVPGLAATSYHTYAETLAEIDQTVANYPQIAKKVVFGKSYQGRDIVGVKISDNVNTDEAEPEVLYIANIHARERITDEQALDLIGILTKQYNSTARITDIVNSREIYIIPIMNPDGQVYDMTSDTQPGRMWRKNRQPNSTSIGTDLNRNFPYKWGCCGGSSGNGSSETYRGPSAASAPETNVMMNFVNSRIVNGVQQLKLFLDIHSNAKLVLWPFGYTYSNTVPGTMTSDEEATHRTIGTQMAQSNGYTPEQSSDLYITDGTTDDWTWGTQRSGTQRLFSFTVELAGSSFYPPPSQIDSLVSNNRNALLTLTEYADCPYRAIGKQAQYCSA